MSTRARPTGSISRVSATGPNPMGRRSLIQRLAAGMVVAPGAVLLAACSDSEGSDGQGPAERATAASASDAAKLETARADVPEGPIGGGTLRHSAGGPIAQDIFTPLRQVSGTQAAVTDHLFLPLWYGTTWGAAEIPTMTGSWDIGAANSWDEIEPNHVYNFHLNPDVAWHDGKPVTVDDALFGVQLGLDNRYGAGMHEGAWGSIDGAQAWGENPTDNVEDVAGITRINDMTIQIALAEPDADWWASRNWHLPPMPRHHFEGLDRDTALDARAVTPLGNGPMVWQRYVTKQFAEMTANPDFAYGAPYVDAYVVSYGDADSLDAATEVGQQDFHRASNIEALQRLAGQPHLRALPQRSPFGSLIFLNQAADVFADMTLEQQSLLIEAMVRAVDREIINIELNAGTLFISDYIFQHVALVSNPPEGTFRPLLYDPDVALALVEESGWNSNSVIRWLIWGQPNPTDLAVQSYWREVGIRTEFQIIDGSAVVEKLYQERAHDLVITNLGGDQTAIDSCLRLCSDQLYELGGWNHSNISRPWIDQGYAEIFATTTEDEAQAAWFDLARRLHAKGEMVAGLLWRESLRNVYHRRVRGAFYMQFFALPVRSPIERVWLDDFWEER